MQNNKNSKKDGIQYLLRKSIKKMFHNLAELGYEDEEIAFKLFLICEEKIFEYFGDVKEAKKFINDVTETMSEIVLESKSMQDFLGIEINSDKRLH